MDRQEFGSRIRPGERFDTMVHRLGAMRGNIRLAGRYDCILIGPDGETKWKDVIHNIVVNEGLDYLLDVGLSLATAIDPWYIGLLAASPSPAAGWVAANVGGAADFTDYTEGVLQEWLETGVSGQSITAAAVSFSINADTSSIGGAFLISTSAKAVPAGTLYSAGAFTGGNKAADSGDTLQVTATFTAADDNV